MPDFLKYNTFVSYLLAFLRSTSLYAMASRVMKYAKRFWFVTRIIKYVSVAAAIIETSAFLVAFAAVLTVTVPILVVLLTAITVADIIISEKLLRCRYFAEYIQDKHICVFLANSGRNDRFPAMLTEKNMAVFIVTADPAKRFISYRYQNGIYYIRHALFFRLKRRRFNKSNNRIIYIL